MIIKLIYTLFLGLLISLFIGLGIDAFYKSPETPEYPSELNLAKPDCGNYEELKEKQEQFDEKQREFIKQEKSYNKNVSIISLLASIIIMIISFYFLSKIQMIADGVLLGGVFTTIYSIIRGLMSNSSQFRFLVVTIGLIIALVLGYLKFIKEKNKADIIN